MIDKKELATYREYYIPFYRSVLRFLLGWDEKRIQAWIDDPAYRPFISGEWSTMYFHEPPEYHLAMYFVWRVRDHSSKLDGETFSRILLTLRKLYETISEKPYNETTAKIVRNELDDIFRCNGIDVSQLKA